MNLRMLWSSMDVQMADERARWRIGCGARANIREASDAPSRSIQGPTFVPYRWDRDGEAVDVATFVAVAPRLLAALVFVALLADPAPGMSACTETGPYPIEPPVAMAAVAGGRRRSSSSITAV